MNDILKIMFDKLNRNEKRKKILFINFRKQKINKLGIKNYYSLAICGKDDQYNQMLNNCKFDIYFDKIVKYNTSEYKEFFKNMKFDVIIGNPPYEGKGNPLYLQILEDLQILEKCNENAKTIVWLCPTQWVKNYKDSEFLKRIKYETCNNLVNHEFVGNPFENAKTANECGIFIFNKNSVLEDYDKIRLERFLNAKLAKSIWDKFAAYSDNIDNHNKIDLKKKYYVRAQWIRGNQDLKTNKPKWDWTTLFGEDQRKDFSFKPKNDKSSPTSFWNFNTIEECKNFIDSTETDILMFAHYISKINNANNNQVLAIIPWLGDYTHKWSEEMIQNELKLTDEEVNYIHEEMKDFGWKAAPKKKKSK